MKYEKPERSALKIADNKWKADDERKAGGLIGFKLDRFRELAEKLDGIQEGVYIVGAETNIGKTDFLADVLIDALKTNSD